MTIAPWMIDAIVVFIVLEFIILRWALMRSGAGHLVAPLLYFLLAGALLVLGVRFAISHGPGALMAAPMTASFFAHAALLRHVAKREVSPKP